MTLDNTEQKVKKAALQVFSEKGYANTKTRDIANLAGVNISTLHYYYRSKDRLYQEVSKEVFQQFNQISDDIFDSDLPFSEKIKCFVERFTDFCKENPNLPSFIVFESERNPEKVYGNIDFVKMDKKVIVELNELIAQKKIRPITYPNFALNLVSLTVFPFLNKHMLFTVNGLSERDFDELLETRKKMVPEMIINYLYL